MRIIAPAVLAAIALAGATLGVAAGDSTASGSKPSSFMPGPHTNRHVYGSPIGQRIVGHTTASRRATTSQATASRHSHANKKQLTRTAARNVRGAPSPHAP